MAKELQYLILSIERPYAITTKCHALKIWQLLTAKTDLPATPTSGDPGNGRVGDPTKKPRPNYPDQSQRGDSSMPAGVLHTLNIVELVDERGQKRKGLDVDETCSLDEWREQYAAGRFITPKNSEEFLEDVNWRVFKFKKRRKLIS
ncbi:unnamed protein product [Fusarium graminearum]|nr:unnamed protein product [Fusarium graminearum]